MARVPCSYQPIVHHALVPLRATNNNEIRAFDEEAGFLTALRCVLAGLVHLPAYYCSHFDASVCLLAVQASAGGDKFG